MKHEWPNGINPQIRAAEVDGDLELTLRWSSEWHHWSVAASRNGQQASVTDASLADAMTFALERVGLRRGEAA
jgi:hypothetical protein